MSGFFTEITYVPFLIKKKKAKKKERKVYPEDFKCYQRIQRNLENLQTAHVDKSFKIKHFAPLALGSKKSDLLYEIHS